MTTLLIEKLNENQSSFINYIRSTKETNISLSDAEVKTIQQALVVHSMSELMERFSPQITMTYREEAITVSLGHRDGLFRQLVFVCEDILQGRYTDVTLEDLKACIFGGTKGSIEEYKKAQEQIFHYLQWNQWKEAIAMMEQCMECFGDALFNLRRLLTQGEIYLREYKAKHRRFVVEAKEGMALQRIAVSEAFVEETYHTEKQEETYRQLLEMVIGDKLKTEANGNRQWRITLIYWNMLMACRMLPEQKLEELHTVLEEQKTIYKEIEESFMYRATPILQTLINCFFYFKKHDKDQLLVTNCSVEELTDDRSRKALMRYLETVNHKQYKEDAIDKVILPNIEEKKKKQILTRERFASSEKAGYEGSTNRREDANMLQELFKQFGIETKMISCDEGEALGYMLTGIDVLKQSSLAEDKELRELCIWLNEWKL